jgi:hypothetical protein
MGGSRQTDALYTPLDMPQLTYGERTYLKHFAAFAFPNLVRVFAFLGIVAVANLGVAAFALTTALDWAPVTATVPFLTIFGAVALVGDLVVAYCICWLIVGELWYCGAIQAVWSAVVYLGQSVTLMTATLLSALGLLSWCIAKAATSGAIGWFIGLAVGIVPVVILLIWLLALIIVRTSCFVPAQPEPPASF